MAKSAEKIKDKVYSAIMSSEDIKEGNYVSVAVEKSGFLFFGSSKLVLTGRTTSEKNKEKIESIARENAGDVEVESRLRVGKTS